MKREGGEPSAQSGESARRLWRVGLYIRLSRDDGESESLSVSNQRKILLEYLETRFQGAFDLTGEYTDDGVTGTDDARPAFQRLLSDVEDGRVDCILCKDLSRVFRNYADQGYYLESRFPLRGTRFICIGHPEIDTFAHPESVQGLEVPITGIMNDRYAEKTSLEVRRTFDSKRRRGEFIGAFAPYGYRKDPLNKNRLLPDEEAADVVRDIFDWYVREGLGACGVARRLNARGVLNPTAYKRARGLCFRTPQSAATDGLWSDKTLRAMLRNEVYAGVLVQGRQRVVSYKVHARVNQPRSEWFVTPGTHEAIVPPETFRQAQELLSRRTRAAPQTQAFHPLSGLLRCAECGATMRRTSARGHAYYICRTYKEKTPAACARHSLREDAALDAALTALRLQQVCLGAVDVSPSASPPRGLARLRELLALRRRELLQQQCLLDSAALRHMAGLLPPERFARLQTLLERETERLRRAIATLEASLAEQTAMLDRTPAAQLDPQLLSGAIRHITVHAHGGLTVAFRFASPWQDVAELPPHPQTLGKRAAPVAPVGPPVDPAGPVGPVGPAGPVGPVGP